MVNFDTLGKRAGEDGYPRIDQHWQDLPDKKRKIIEALIRFPEKSQKEIAAMADETDTAHVHRVVYSLPSEEFNKYKGQMLEESDVEINRDIPQKGDEDTVTVTAPMKMSVDITIPRKDLANAATAAIGEEFITASNNS